MPMFPRLPRGVSRRILGILARYITLYACLIVLFAGLYAVWPDDFYQPNIKSEPAARAEKAALGHEVKAAMNAQFEREPDLGRNVRFELLTGVRIGAERDNALTGSASISVSLERATVPFKANAARRHRIPKQRHRVTNWAEYDAALRRRGSLTVWFTAEVIAAWRAEPRTTRGGQPRYSALAIRTALTLRAVFRLALRQTEGLIGSSEQLAMNGPSGDPDQTIARFLIINGDNVANVVFDTAAGIDPGVSTEDVEAERSRALSEANSGSQAKMAD